MTATAPSGITHRQGHKITPQAHHQYFEGLQSRLLKESDKLTHLMRRSNNTGCGRNKIRSVTSLERSKPIIPRQQQGSSYQTETHNFRKALDNCQKLKVTALNQKRSKSRSETEKKEEVERSKVYNLSGFQKSEGDRNLKIPKERTPLKRSLVVQDRSCSRTRQKKKPQEMKKHITTFSSHNLLGSNQSVKECRGDLKRSKKENMLNRAERVQKMCKALTYARSLKDTVSTDSCKSTNQDKSVSPRLADFKVLSYLAEGKTGNVFLVMHKATGFICALKRISGFLKWTDEKQINQRIREMKIQSFLDHPHIVQLYSVFVEEGDLFLLMEPCISGTLYTNLRKAGKFKEEKLRECMKQICHGVEFMHDNDILHRDIKPENILYHECVVKICDLGWSVYSPLLRDTLCGSPVYSSPEIVQQRQYDSKIDIWNLGVLAYQLLYGRVPFEVRSSDELNKIIEQEIYFPNRQKVSQQVKDFILRCLSKDPKERISITQLVDHPFLNSP